MDRRRNFREQIRSGRSTAALLILCLTSGAVVSEARAEEPRAQAATLLYLLSSKDADHADKLGRCDRLTIDEYKKRGVRVIAKTADAVAAWVKGKGRNYAKATTGFQQVAYARSLGADAVGGLGAWAFSDEEATHLPGSPEAGVYFHGWGFAIEGIYRNNVFTMQYGEKVQPIPLGLSASSDDPWSIATKVRPNPCSPGATHSRAVSDRPFLGVGLDEKTRVTTVTKNSPAAAAGLRVGDILRSIDGRPIDARRALVDILSARDVGDTIEVVYTRDGTDADTKVSLLDRATVEAINSPVGKPLPDLVARDVRGKEVRLRDFRGSVVLLDVWATWCPPCVEGSPVLQLLFEHAKDKHDDFVWLGVSVDEDERAWKDFIEHNHLGGTQVRGPEWAKTLSVNGFPTLLLVDRSGVVRCELHDANIASATMTLLERE